jgi:Spy/CpxP family protein refolding chaperone
MTRFYMVLLLVLLFAAPLSAQEEEEMECCGMMGSMGMMGGGMEMMRGGMMEEGMHRMRHGMRGMADRVLAQAESMGLSAEQKKALREMSLTQKKEMIRLHSDLMIARVELADLLQEEEPDMQKVEGKVKEVADLRAQVMLARIKARQGMQATLTPEQRKKLESMPGMKGMMGRGMREGEKPEGSMQGGGHEEHHQ